MIQKGIRPAPECDTTVAAPQGRALERLLEAILFVGTEPLTVERIRNAFPNLNPAIIQRAIRRLASSYSVERRPYRIRAKKLAQSGAVGYRMELEPELLKEIRAKARVERSARLPRATIEVLSLVAYRQPITKLDLETLLGIDPSGPLRQLLRRGLITRHEPEGGGGGGPNSASATYRTSERFLELFRLSSLDELPASDDAL